MPRLIESPRTLLETKMRLPRNYWKSLVFSAFLQREVLPPGPGVVTTQSGGGYHLSRGVLGSAPTSLDGGGVVGRSREMRADSRQGLRAAHHDQPRRLVDHPPVSTV